MQSYNRLRPHCESPALSWDRRRDSPEEALMAGGPKQPLESYPTSGYEFLSSVPACSPTRSVRRIAIRIFASRGSGLIGESGRGFGGVPGVVPVGN